MNNFIIKKRNIKSGVIEFGNIIFTDKIKALERANELNEAEINKDIFIHTVVEVIEVEQEKRYECDMEEDELKEYRETILAIEKDLCDNILSYDEWAALEYGDNKVDTYWTALNLYNAGSRKVIDFKECDENA